MSIKCVDYEKLTPIDITIAWHTHIHQVLADREIQESLLRAKKAIARKQSIKTDVSSWPVLLLYPTDDLSDQEDVKQALLLLHTTRETAIADYERKSDDVWWYLCNHYCWEMSFVWLQMAKKAYPRLSWERCWCIVDGCIHITVADTTNGSLFDLQLWSLGYI